MAALSNKALTRRLAGQHGFTLIELLVVIVIIGILLAIAVPSYLGFRTRAQNAAAQANLRSAIPDVEAYYADYGAYNNATPALTNATLKASYDSGISSGVILENLTANTYCMKYASASGTNYYVQGPGGTPSTTQGSCS